MKGREGLPAYPQTQLKESELGYQQLLQELDTSLSALESFIGAFRGPRFSEHRPAQL